MVHLYFNFVKSIQDDDNIWFGTRYKTLNFMFTSINIAVTIKTPIPAGLAKMLTCMFASSISPDVVWLDFASV